jgi:hypothetical protein
MAVQFSGADLSRSKSTLSPWAMPPVNYLNSRKHLQNRHLTRLFSERVGHLPASSGDTKCQIISLDVRYRLLSVFMPPRDIVL